MNTGRQILIFILLALPLSGCRHPESGQNGFYSEKKHGISFEYPSSFKKTGGKELWSRQTWKSQDGVIILSFRAEWNQDLKYFPPEMSLDMYFTTLRSKNPRNSIYTEEIIPFILKSGSKGIAFRASGSGESISGLYVVENNREYVLTLSASRENQGKAFDEAWTMIKKSFNVIILPDHKKYVKQLIADGEKSENAKIKDILDYGQQLMSNKEAYSKNYPRAIIEIRRALGIMENLTPKPQEYMRALRLIYIAKELQRKAYEQHERLFISHARQFCWEEAKREAVILLDLMGDDRESPRAQHARDFLKIAVKALKRTKKQE